MESLVSDVQYVCVSAVTLHSVQLGKESVHISRLCKLSRGLVKVNTQRIVWVTVESVRRTMCLQTTNLSPVLHCQL